MKLTVNKLLELTDNVIIYEWSKENKSYKKVAEWNRNNETTIQTEYIKLQSIGNRVVDSLLTVHGSLRAFIVEDKFEDFDKEYLETKVQKLEELLDEMEKILEIRKMI